MFRSLFQDHLQGLSLVLSAYHASAARFVICLYWYVVVCPLYLYPLYLPECCLVVNSERCPIRTFIEVLNTCKTK
jgi:hypothetical protein